MCVCVWILVYFNKTKYIWLIYQDQKTNFFNMSIHVFPFLTFTYNSLLSELESYKMYDRSDCIYENEWIAGNLIMDCVNVCLDK